jgi:hypothetical protein
VRSKILIALLFAFAATATVSFAESIVGDFTLDSNLNTIASQGQVTFTLNGNGTIAASLVSYNSNIVGFGFDSVNLNLAESGFSPTAVDNPYGWTNSFGLHRSGILCRSCGLTESWTIGDAGDFSSVLQALGGNAATTDFFLYTNAEGQFGAMEHSAVPEPGSLALIGAGLAGVALLRRRRV